MDIESKLLPGKFTDILLVATKQLSKWLEESLPSLDDGWWSSLVLPALSYQQRQSVDRKNISSLEELDLAALLRVFDQNWYQFTQQFNFTTQNRHYVKEMQTIRNRWAHINTKDLNFDDVYRDIDTLQRFLQILAVDDRILLEVKQFKNSILKPPTASLTESEEIPKNKIHKEVSQNSKIFNANINIGNIVALNSDPSKQGAVVEIEGQTPESRCKIFLEGKLQPFYVSQIHLFVPEETKNIVSLPELHSLLTCLQIRHPSLSTLYSLNAARIDFVPYQFRPALKIIRSDQPRLLIADGVGVGKTIEAGLVLRELQARNNISSVLIICPKPLVAERKWELEMKRFDERFTHLDGKALRLCIEETDNEGEWPDQHSKTIIPYSLFDEVLLDGKSIGRRHQLGLLDLDPPPHFDLVIVDEAHHIRNTSTFTHQVVKFFCENAEALLFLTATPIQLGNQDLFTLLNLLRPDLVIDPETFNHMAEPNPYINEALSEVRTGVEANNQLVLDSLNNAGNTAWGSTILQNNPVFNEVCDKLMQDDLSREDRVLLIRKIESFHSFSRLINRTRRRDIDDFCIRRNETIEIDFTDSQRDLHNQLLHFEANALSMIHNTNNVNFMMSTIRRQAASCIFGLAPLINQILNRRLTDLEGLTSGDETMPDPEIIESLQKAALDIVHLAGTLSEDDPKFEAFYQIVEDKQKLEQNKIMVFSTFKHTLFYLEKKLLQKDIRLGLIHGDIKDDERLIIRSRFELPKENPDAIDVMLFSEVGCEGLDYQFCDVMINYDLPWNPMRIEQRIGRIDRRGQKSEMVLIYNLITPSTVDADIYNRCLLRIGVFEQSIGDCEDILGDIHQEIRNIVGNQHLSEEERQEKLEQLADNEVRHIQEQRILEDREHELFGIRLPNLSADNEIRDSESFWLTMTSIQRFVLQYFNKRLGKGDYILGEKALKTLRLSQDARDKILSDFRKLPTNKTPMHRTWEKWLKGSGQHCTLTFDSACASDQRDAHFIMPLHPLVIQAAFFFETAEPVYTALRVNDTDLSAGEYLFAIYAWEYKGIRPDLKLIPVCGNKSLQQNFFDYLETGAEIDPHKMLPTDDAFENLDKFHHEIWQKEKLAHDKKTNEICSYRRESLETSHRGRVNVISDQIVNATNDKIRRMKQAQLYNTQAEFERQIEELQKAATISDIYARPVVFGIIKVEGD
jgi:ATP-dependent helicase HepA